MAHDRTTVAYDVIIMGDVLPGRLRTAVRAALSRCAIDREYYDADFGPAAVIAEEHRHAQDARFCEAANACDLTRTPRWILDIFRAITRESSPLAGEYMISRADFSRLQPHEQQNTAQPVVEYAGQLGALIAQMRVAIAHNDLDLAYAVFLHYYAIVRYRTAQEHARDQERDYRDFLKSCLRGGYIKISRHFVDDVSTAVAEEAEYFFMHALFGALRQRGFEARTEEGFDEALFAFLEGTPDEHPAAQALQLLNAMYARDFLSDEERRAILIAQEALPAQPGTIASDALQFSS